MGGWSNVRFSNLADAGSESAVCSLLSSCERNKTEPCAWQVVVASNIKSSRRRRCPYAAPTIRLQRPLDQESFPVEKSQNPEKFMSPPMGAHLSGALALAKLNTIQLGFGPQPRASRGKLRPGCWVLF